MATLASQFKKQLMNMNVRMEPIDLRKLFRAKNPGIAKWIPQFVYNYIDRIVHIDETNEIIAKYGHLRGADFASAIVKHFNVKEDIIGLENIPTEGRFIFAANHPLGGFDAMLLMNEVTKHLGGEFRFLANDILTAIKPLEDVFIPINKFGTKSRNAARLSQEAYDSNKQILIFPAGLNSRKIDGKIQDTEWHKHFIQKSIEHKRDVILVHIDGKNSNFFYNLSNFRRAIGIKWNLEMFYLADEFFKQRGRTFQLTFSKPIPYNTFDKSKSQKAWAKELRNRLFELPTKIKK
ncbi:MAG: 1-acyl-sn-glycerol-3-phosphate acyltransferase [Mangrovibacterium sp.]